MKISIHNTIIGKPVKVQPVKGAPWLEVNGQRVNLGYGWINCDLSWPEVFEIITVDGCATSAELASDHRDESNFCSRELIMVDIDSGMTIEQLLADDFYNKFGAGFYVTPSHTIDHHRFRIMFRTAEPITDAYKARQLMRALMRVYDYADPACKDATRLFYGTINAEFKEYRSNILPKTEIDLLLTMIEAFDQEHVKQIDHAVNHQPLTNQGRQDLLEVLRSQFVGEYNQWIKIGWGLRHAGFSVDDFIYVTVGGLMREKTAEDAKIVWDDWRPNHPKPVTLGSVFNFLSQRLGQEFVHELITLTQEPEILTGTVALQALQRQRYQQLKQIRGY